MMRKRTLSYLALVTLVILFVWLGGAALAAAIGVIAAAGILEFCGMVGLRWRHPLAIFGLAGVLLFVVVAYFEWSHIAPLLAAVVGFSLILLLLRSPVESAAARWSWTLAGILYIGWLLSHFIPLRALDSGRDLVYLAVFTTVAADTIAFFAGLAWGRHKLAPRISAGKSWEGAVGGFAAAIGAAVLLAYALPSLSLPAWQAVSIGAIVGLLAPLGDLTESMLKRSAGLKDSGRIVPGHGGILDRLDSMLFTVVAVYYFVIYVVI